MLRFVVVVRSLVLAVTTVSICIEVATAATTEGPLCGKCLPRSVTLTAADGSPGSVTPTIKVLPNTKQGCRQMNVICTTPAGFTKVSMRFNDETAALVGKNVTQLLSCFKASWHTTFQGSYIYVDSVKCTAS